MTTTTTTRCFDTILIGVAVSKFYFSDRIMRFILYGIGTFEELGFSIKQHV
jgi:hypothetical protein